MGAPELWSGLSSCDLHGAFEAELLQQSAELRRSDAPIGGGDPAWGRPLTPGVDAPMLVADHSGLQPPLAAGRAMPDGMACIAVPLCVMWITCLFFPPKRTSYVV